MIWVIKTLLRGGMFTSKRRGKLSMILVFALLLLVFVIREDDTDAVVKRRLNKLYSKYNLSLDDFGHTNFSGNHSYLSGNVGNGTKGIVKGEKLQKVLTSHLKQHVEAEHIPQGEVNFVKFHEHKDDDIKVKPASKQKVMFAAKVVPLNDDNVQVLNPQVLQNKHPVRDKVAVDAEEEVKPQPPLLPIQQKRDEKQEGGNKEERETKKQALKNEEKTPDIKEKKKSETKNIKEPDAKKMVQKKSLKEFFKQNQANHVKEEKQPQIKEKPANTFRDRQGRTLPKELYDLAPGVFDMVPNEFDSDMKNPCWMGDDQKVKCLPYFYIIGMPDSGSENLWQKIEQHPSVAETQMTGYHWWNRRRARDKEDMLTSFQKYLTLGNSVVSELEKQNYEMVYGEHSTSLLWDNDWWEAFYPDFQEAPKYTAADILAAFQPKVKLLIILSEPGTLVYNNYLISTSPEISSPDDFDAKLMNSIDIFEECLKNHKKRTCIYQKFQKKDETVRLKWGFLSQYFADWLKVFPLSQFKILEKNSFESNCLVELPKIYSFLELERLSMKEVRQICQTQSLIYRRPPPESQPMTPSTKNFLTEYFGPYLDELDELLSKQ
ncbi:Carbohydrate sulfotransferase 15 [Holothuria leucospilota]|uniref:Carbohydrate sulfotransferase 15 n=1 Tax=Holothuria leucospilota TaxID=206669 RepID=A0A9Q1H3F3_HOLLE|nr:Carbohydrate sulfotransferase 15 [Holothuria leucospilota]